MAGDLLKSVRSHSVVCNSVLEIFVKHGYTLGEFSLFDCQVIVLLYFTCSNVSYE